MLACSMILTLYLAVVFGRPDHFGDGSSVSA
jgi:hypothetical protein